MSYFLKDENFTRESRKSQAKKDRMSKKHENTKHSTCEEGSPRGKGGDNNLWHVCYFMTAITNQLKRV